MAYDILKFNGFALNGKVYPNGIIPIAGGKYSNLLSDIGFGKVVSGTVKPNPLTPNSICDLILPGVYSTSLSDLNNMDGFGFFMDNCFPGVFSTQEVPVLIFVPEKNFRDLGASNDTPEKQLLLLQYSQSHEAENKSYDRSTIYNALAGKPVPEFSFADMQHLSYSVNGTPTGIDNININDIIKNTARISVYYDGQQLSFYTTIPNAYLILYVGGYGFKVYYPSNYVFSNFSFSSRLIAIRRYETISITNYSSGLDNQFTQYQRGYTFTPIKNSGSSKTTVAWSDPNPYVPTADAGAITYSYENQSNIEVSLDMPYNPAIYTMLGQEPFNQKITLSSGFTSLDNIGIIHSGGKIQDRTWASKIENFSNASDYCLPQGEYLLPDKSTIGNTPVNTGMYTLNVFSAGNGSMIQQVLTDPGVTEYNKYTRSWSKANKAYGSWSGTYQI